MFPCHLEYLPNPFETLHMHVGLLLQGPQLAIGRSLVVAHRSEDRGGSGWTSLVPRAVSLFAHLP